MPTRDDEQMMRLALAEAGQALAEGEFPVGCVLTLAGRAVASGRRRNSRGSSTNELDHAEVATLRSLMAAQPGLDCRQLVAYSTLEPCLMCFSTLLLSGVRRFVWAYEDAMGGGTALPLVQLAPLYQNMAPELTPGVLRSESLELFARFFQSHSYWQGSLLAKCTLAEHRQIVGARR